MTVKVAVIYYSATGTVHALAQAVAEGAASAGATVRLLRVAELAPDSAIDQDPLWRRHADAAAPIAQASVEDLVRADAFAFGTPTPQLKQFIDQTSGLWREGSLADKPEGDRVTDAGAGDGNARGTKTVTASQTA
jgi:NAD(P)H dehydrogenase (quinone)